MTKPQADNQFGRPSFRSSRGRVLHGLTWLAAILWSVVCPLTPASAQTAPPTPGLHVVDALPSDSEKGEEKKADEKMTWLTTHGELTQTVLVESRSPNPITDLRISSTPLRKDNQVAALTIHYAEKETPVPGKPLALQLTAELPEPGTYVTTLTFDYKGGRGTLALEITRVELKSSIDVLGVNAGRGTLGLRRLADVSLGMSFHAKDNAPATVRSVQLTGLTLKIKDADVQALYNSATVTVSDVPAGQPSFDVRPETPRRVQLRLQGIREAGEYKASVRVALADAAPVDRDIVFYVRENGGVAVMFLLLGVLLSTAVALYAKYLRRRLQQQRVVLRLYQDAADLAEQWKPLAGQEATVFDRVRTLLDELWREATLRDGIAGDVFVQDPAVPPPDLTSKITGLNGKLRLFSAWVAARRRVAKLADALKPKYQPVLDAACDYLLGATGTEVTFESQRIALDKLQADLDRDIRIPETGAETPAAVAPQPNVANPAFVKQLLRRLTTRRDRFDVLVVVCFVAVGVLLGWKLFWVDNLTWGGWSDRVKCLLWGFGLHQITEATVVAGGLLGIRDWFRSSSSSA